MASSYGTIHLKVVNKRLKVIGMGQTPRGQNFIKQVVGMNARSPADPKFKAELATAVDELFA